MSVSKAVAGITCLSGGGMLAIVNVFQNAAGEIKLPPPNLSWFEWLDFYSKGVNVLVAAAVATTGIIFLILRHRETKRHNRAMEGGRREED